MGRLTQVWPLIYLDANVFVAGFETPAGDAVPAQELFRALAQKTGVAVSSELSLAELLAPIRRPHAFSQRERRELYLNLLQRGGIVDLKPITREILLQTADLRSIINYKLPDAIHIVTATEAGCAYFVSNDARIKELPPGLRKTRADQTGVDELLQALSQRTL